MLYRRFSYLQARLLLYKQDELRDLELELDHLDAIDENKDPRLLRSRERDDATSGLRKRLIGEIEEKFNEYCTCLQRIRIESQFDFSSAYPRRSSRPLDV
jgi:hypothetical protein